MKTRYQLIFSLLFYSVFHPDSALGQDKNNSITLSLKPKECVVYKEGDKCYVNVEIKWNAGKSAALCLFRNPNEVKLHCWGTASEGQFSENLEMDEPVDYYLVYDDNSEILIKRTLALSWVYKKSSRPEQTWRLF